MFGIIGVNPTSLIISEIVKRTRAGEEMIFFDDDPLKLDKTYFGIPVKGTIRQLKDRVDGGEVFNLCISLGEKYLKKRKELFHQLTIPAKTQFPVIRHESCIISSLAEIEPGNILSFGVIVGHKARLKANSVIWSGTVIEHDSVIGESCYLAPHVTISGCVEIGDCTLIGSGATILPEIKIGAHCIVGAGAVVTKNIPDNSVVAGVPAKIIRKCN